MNQTDKLLSSSPESDSTNGFLFPGKKFPTNIRQTQNDSLVWHNASDECKQQEVTHLKYVTVEDIMTPESISFVIELQTFGIVYL